MLPDVWLENPNIKKLKKSKFASQSNAAFINLADSLFKTYDLSKGQVASIVELLEASSEWPKEKPGDFYLAAQLNKPIAWVNLADEVEPTPDWVLEVINLLLAIPSDVSVIDLNCGVGAFADCLPRHAFYEGYDINPVQIMRAQEYFSNYMFKCSDISAMLSKEPDTSYGLVLFNAAYWQCDTKQIDKNACLELIYRTDVFNATDVAVELSVKCAVRGGVVVLYSYEKPSYDTLEWLRSKGTILAFITVGKACLLLFRNGVKSKKEINLADELFHFETEREAIEWAVEKGVITRVPVCAEDPRPLLLKDWNVAVKPNALGFSASFESWKEADVELYLAKNKIKIKFKDQWSALEWAQHQALTASPEETWNKTVEKFSVRFELNNYISLRSGDLNRLVNLPETYTVLEEPALRKYLNKAQRQIAHMSFSYPEKTTLDNRYYTLGIGSVLTDGSKKYEVKFSEPDFSNSKPPKVHLERIE